MDHDEGQGDTSSPEEATIFPQTVQAKMQKTRGYTEDFLLQAQLANRASPATTGSPLLVLALESLDMNDQGSQEHNTITTGYAAAIVNANEPLLCLREVEE
jgi:hypothetical protein